MINEIKQPAKTISEEMLWGFESPVDYKDTTGKPAIGIGGSVDTEDAFHRCECGSFTPGFHFKGCEVGRESQ